MAHQLETRPSNTVDEVGRTGVYPVSGPWPTGDAAVVGQGALGHPEQRRLLGALPRPYVDLDKVSLAFGRVVFGGFCLYNGINHFRQREMLTGYARSKNVPLPGVAVIGSGVLLALGGLSLITGIKPKIGASLVTSFLAGVSPVMHNFWAVEDEQQRMAELVNFTKNMALIGGSCFAAAVPEPWPASVPTKG